MPDQRRGHPKNARALNNPYQKNMPRNKFNLFNALKPNCIQTFPAMQPNQPLLIQQPVLGAPSTDLAPGLAPDLPTVDLLNMGPSSLSVPASDSGEMKVSRELNFSSISLSERQSSFPPLGSVSQG